MAMGKIAFVATVFRHLEAFHLPFMQMLQEEGHEVHAYAAPDIGRNAVIHCNVICHNIPFCRNPYHVKNISAIRDLFKSFRQEQFQLVHVHTPVAGLITRIAAKLAKVPCVMYTAHGFHFFKGSSFINWLLYYPLERILAGWTDYLITINKEDYVNSLYFPVRKKKVLVPGVGVDTSRFSVINADLIRNQKREEIGLKKEDFVIIFVAELNENKNQIQIIETMKHLQSRYGFVKCLLVGDGDKKFFLAQEIKQMGLEHCVYLLGFRRDIPELYACSDVMTLLSKREGLPKSLMEAMAAGKPIVTTDVRGNRDLVKHGENGFIVSIGDVVATIQSVENLIHNRALGNQMGITNKKLVREYELPLIVEVMRSIYMDGLQSVPDRIIETDTRLNRWTRRI